jgi:uncharacterized protein YggU (UPF0235/DUF167 family)
MLLKSINVMIISVQVKLFKKNSSIEVAEDMFGNKTYIVSVNAIPEKGQANKELIGVLSNYFNVIQSNIKILSGSTSTRKIIEVSEIE